MKRVVAAVPSFLVFVDHRKELSLYHLLCLLCVHFPTGFQRAGVLIDVHDTGWGVLSSRPQRPPECPRTQEQSNQSE